MKELLFFEWVVVDNCNFHCDYCVNKGEYSHKVKADMIYVPGREVEIARRIVAISEKTKRVVVNLTGGEPLMARDIVEVIEILGSRSNISIQLITNFARMEKIVSRVPRLDSIIVSLHIRQRPESRDAELIALINSVKPQVKLRLTQVDYELEPADRARLANISARTGCGIEFQRFIPPWTDIARPDNAKEVSDATFVRSFGKRCSLGYFYYFILPDGTFYHGLWCNPKTRQSGNFLAPFSEIAHAFDSTGMMKCQASSCGCNYNTFYYDEYRTACKRLQYPRRERFGPENLRDPYPVRTAMRGVARKVKGVLRRVQAAMGGK